MEKIILRKNILSRGFVNSSFISLSGDERYSGKDKVIKNFGYKETMKRLFDENLENDNLTESNLYRLFLEMSDADCQENDKFVKVYKIDDEFGLRLDANIYLYHLIPKKELYSQIVPWYYADGEKYLGDTWWEQDEEIIENIRNLSLIDFLKRYKGY